MTAERDHGGGLDAAIARHGGTRAEWIDLSTGINPVPYPIPEISDDSWNALPDDCARKDVEQAARRFWNIPQDAAVLTVPGLSAAIARLPGLREPGSVRIHKPTYNEYAAAFSAAGWEINAGEPTATVLVHPNNPDGRLFQAADIPKHFTIIDESFCDTQPDKTLIHLAGRPDVLVLKSFGKFWGRAGLRLGFVIGDVSLIRRISDLIGPWPVSGPALTIGTAALNDDAWAEGSRQRLAGDADRMDALMKGHGANVVGGTSLFRLYSVDDAAGWQDRLARAHIWTRVFPYDPRWMRLGLPAPHAWSRLEAAL